MSNDNGDDGDIPTVVPDEEMIATAPGPAVDEPAQAKPMTGMFWIVGVDNAEKAMTEDYLLQDIFFGVVKPGSPVEQQSLRNRIDRTLSALKSIYSGKEGESKRDEKKRLEDRTSFNEAFGKLHSLAALGLAGEKPDTNVANAALDSLHAEIVNREGGRVKNGYMIRLGLPAFIAAILSTSLYMLYEYWVIWPDEVFRYRNIFLVLAGCMAGTWASFAGRKLVLNFFDLAVLEKDQLDPVLRLLFVSVLTTILVLIFTTGLIDVVIGNFKASALLSSGSVAVLVGAFAGISEQTLPNVILQRAKGFVDGVKSE